MTDSVAGVAAARPVAAGPVAEPTAEPASVGALSWGRAAYDAFADGLYTYCLSVLRDQTAAAESLRNTFVLADRHIGRLPDLDLLKPWLYALARYECLIRLDAPARPPVKNTRGGPDPAALAWPEAVGLDPQQREALELAVRHGLDARGLAAVLGFDEPEGRRILLQAGGEVDRTRAAVAGAGAARACTEGQELTSVRLTVLRRERLLEHTAGCPVCGPQVRSAATRLAPTSGAAAAPDPLPLVSPPPGLRAEVLAEVGRGRSASRPADLSRKVHGFDRHGFPVFRDPLARQRVRRRATLIAVAVVAAVVAAPVAALWQASRNPVAVTLADGTVISNVQVTTGRPTDRATAGTASAKEGAGLSRPGVEGTSAQAEAPAAQEPPGAPVTATVSVTATTEVRSAPGVPAPVLVPAEPVPSTGPPQPVPPQVDVSTSKDRTVITLRNPGRAPVDWAAVTGAPWLVLSRTSGTLEPGAVQTVEVTVDAETAPAGRWTAKVRIDPGDSVVTIKGYSRPSTSPSGSVTPSG